MTTISEATQDTRLSLLETQLREFTDEQRQVNADQREHNARTDAFIAEQREHNARTDAFIDEQREHNARTDAFIDEQRDINADQRRFNARVDAFMANTTDRMDRMQGDISTLLGAHDEQRVKDDANGIASEMNCRLTRVLSKDDLLAMHQRQDTADIDKGALRSFRQADLIIEAATPEGNAIYIAMEISHTADRRDTDRALRNCDLITRFTGHPALPAIASVRNDRHAQALVDSGQVYWYGINQA